MDQRSRVMRRRCSGADPLLRTGSFVEKSLTLGDALHFDRDRVDRLLDALESRAGLDGQLPLVRFPFHAPHPGTNERRVPAPR